MTINAQMIKGVWQYFERHVASADSELHIHQKKTFSKMKNDTQSQKINHWKLVFCPMICYIYIKLCIFAPNYKNNYIK